MKFASDPSCAKCGGQILHLVAGEDVPSAFSDVNSNYWSVWLRDGSRRHARCRPGVQLELCS